MEDYQKAEAENKALKHRINNLVGELEEKQKGGDVIDSKIKSAGKAK